ncbi:hypothetical protein [Streptomyces albipurpureus]|uniref:Minor tail protein n=1 Tax=Streptomyces albipurpureus TaxID=2897419 RepID=A0ABT0US42_9ACTN|nr:hypothetical protein [Streptomyces sp. CWNU-1]MCM2390203.1 hypothetical protein [Streptomyces sp. CWNU-1]
MTFPLAITTEIQLGGVWTDITPYVRGAMSITAGRDDETQKVKPTKLPIQLNNGDGRFSRRNPRSPWSGLIGHNTPVRTSVPGPEPYLTVNAGTDCATTPDHASLDIVGDLDVRAEATLDWTWPRSQWFASKWDEPANQRSFIVYVRDGLLYIHWSEDGTTTNSWFVSRRLPELPRRAALRVTLDVNNGIGGWTVRFYWATSLAGSWVEIGEPYVYPGITSIHAGTAPLTVARPSIFAPPAGGRIHAVQVRNGIGGSIVAGPVFTAQTPGTSSFVDSAGRTWTMIGTAEVTRRDIRMSGEIPSWPVRWDLSGADVWVSTTASGILRRLGQGQKPVPSTLRRRIPSGQPVAYWPMEDGATATTAASPIPGVTPMKVTGLDFAADSSLAGSGPLPKIKTGATLTATVPPYLNTGAWQIEVVYHLDAASAAWTTILDVYTRSNPWAQFTVQISTAGVRIIGTNADGDATSSLLTIGIADADIDGQWNRLQLRSEQDGLMTRLGIQVIPISGTSVGWATSYAGAVGAVQRIQTAFDAELNGVPIGHLAVFPVYQSTIYNFADHGYLNELVPARMRRVTDEVGQVPLTIRGRAADSEGLGPQRPASLLTLLQQAADTDGGILYEARDRPGLIYRTRTTLYNQAPVLTLDYTAPGHIAAPFEPLDDDKGVVNDVTVTRSGGSSARVVRETGPMSTAPPPDGVGIYDESVTRSLARDAQCEQIAAWRVHLGTADEARYPTVRILLHRAPELIPQVLGIHIGDKITITNPPDWLPPEPIELIVQGYKEILDTYTWEITYTCTPARPWTVGVLNHSVLGRLDTAGSQLASGVTATATSWSVTTTAGPRWITTGEFPAQFPFDITIGGERVTVTAISGTSSPQTFTVVRSANTIIKPHPTATKLSLTTPLRLAL